MTHQKTDTRTNIEENKVLGETPKSLPTVSQKHDIASVSPEENKNISHTLSEIRELFWVLPDDPSNISPCRGRGGVPKRGTTKYYMEMFGDNGVQILIGGTITFLAPQIIIPAITGAAIGALLGKKIKNIKIKKRKNNKITEETPLLERDENIIDVGFEVVETPLLEKPKK